MRQANLIMMSAAMLLAACGGTKDAGLSLIHIYVYKRQSQDFFLFLQINVNENHHRKQYPVDNFTAVAPLMDFLLNWKEIFDPHFRKPLTRFFLVTNTYDCHQPTF